MEYALIIPSLVPVSAAGEACQRSTEEVLLVVKMCLLPRHYFEHKLYIELEHTMKDDCIRVLTCFSEIQVNPCENSGWNLLLHVRPRAFNSCSLPGKIGASSNVCSVTRSSTRFDPSC